jgi:hypothetical protein
MAHTASPRTVYRVIYRFRLVLIGSFVEVAATEKRGYHADRDSHNSHAIKFPDTNLKLLPNNSSQLVGALVPRAVGAAASICPILVNEGR